MNLRLIGIRLTVALSVLSLALAIGQTAAVTQSQLPNVPGKAEQSNSEQQTDGVESPAATPPDGQVDTQVADRVQGEPQLGRFGNYLAGVVAYKRRDWLSAADFLTRVREQDPNHREQLPLAMMAQLVAGLPQKALASAEQVIELVQREQETEASYVFWAVLLLAINALAQGELDAAEQYLANLPESPSVTASSTSDEVSVTVKVVTTGKAGLVALLRPWLTAAVDIKQVDVPTLTDPQVLDSKPSREQQAFLLLGARIHELRGEDMLAIQLYNRSREIELQDSGFSPHIVEALAGFEQRRGRDATAIYTAFEQRRYEDIVLAPLQPGEPSAQLEDSARSRDSDSPELSPDATESSQTRVAGSESIPTDTAEDQPENSPTSTDPEPADSTLTDTGASQSADPVASEPLDPQPSPLALEQLRAGLADTLIHAGRGIFPLICGQLALMVHPDHPLAAVMVAENLLATDYPEQSLSLYRQAIAYDHPLGWRWEIGAAEALGRLERPAEQQQLLEQARVRYPGNAHILEALGHSYRAAGNCQQGVQLYTQVLELMAEDDPQRWVILYYRAVCFEENGDWPKAEDDLEQALVLNPDQPILLNNLGYSWADMGVNLDQALEMITKAVEIRPSGHIIDSLGWVFYRLGRLDEAVEQLERAASIHPFNAVIVDHLGDAYWDSGRHREAIVQWRRALEETDDPELAAAIGHKLANRAADQ